MAIKKVAVIGATGMLGQPVTRQFLRAGFEVSVLARNVKKAQKIFGPGVRIIKGDLEDISSIKELINGQDALYLSLSVEQNSRKTDFQPERDGLENLLEAARSFPLMRIGYLSSLVQFYQGLNGFDWWVFQIKQEAIAKIKSSGHPYSIFYPSTFMENFDKGAYVQGNAILLAGRSVHPMFFISGDDYGRQVANAFHQDKGNREYVIQGPEAYTADQAAKIYAENYTSARLSTLKMPLGLLYFLGNFSKKLNYGARIIDALNNYPEKFEAGDTWEELGRPETTFADYIRKVNNE